MKFEDVRNDYDQVTSLQNLKRLFNLSLAVVGLMIPVFILDYYRYKNGLWTEQPNYVFVLIAHLAVLLYFIPQVLFKFFQNYWEENLIARKAFFNGFLFLSGCIAVSNAITGLITFGSIGVLLIFLIIVSTSFFLELRHLLLVNIILALARTGPWDKIFMKLSITLSTPD